MKHDLRDVTFLIPVKIDSKSRARNLFITYNYISRLFDTNIIICEQCGNYVPLILNDTKYDYINFSGDNNMKRANQFNIMAKKATTQIIVGYDCDVILYPQDYIDATNLIRNNMYDIIYPYNGKFLEVPDNDVIDFALNYDIERIDTSKLLHVGPPDKPSVGGATFYKKDIFIKYGMENENIYGWGFDDDERIYRFTLMGARISRTKGPLLHMEHPKNLYNYLINQNIKELQRIRSMDYDQLNAEISKWEWTKNDNI